MQTIVDRVQSLNIASYYIGKTIRQENLRTIRESIVNLDLYSSGTPVPDGWIHVAPKHIGLISVEGDLSPYGNVEVNIRLPSGASVTIPLIEDVTFERTDLAIARIMRCFSGCAMSYSDCNELRDMLSESTGLPGHAIEIVAHRAEGKLEAIVTRGGESWSSTVAAVGIVYRTA